MTEEQPNDVSAARAAAVPHAPARELPLQQWEGEGGAMPTDESRAASSKAATTEADPDAITERHFFAQSEYQLKR